MSSETDWQAITDPQFRKEMAEFVKQLMDDPDGFRPEAIRARGWVACPFEIGPLIDPELAEQVCSMAGGNDVLAVQVDWPQHLPSPDLPECYRISPVPEHLEKWSVQESWTNWLVIPGNEELVVLCTMENYNVVAGKKRLVEYVLGQSVEDAHRKFVSFAHRMASSGTELARHEEQFLLEQAERYVDRPSSL